MGVTATELGGQKRINVCNVDSGCITFKSCLCLSHTQFVPVVVANRFDDVMVAIVHVEETNAKLPASNATELADCNFHSLDG